MTEKYGEPRETGPKWGLWDILEFRHAPWLDNMTNGAELCGKVKRKGKTFYLVKIQHGTCHCGVCNHKTTWDCDTGREHECLCCHDLCT